MEQVKQWNKRYSKTSCFYLNPCFKLFPFAVLSVGFTIFDIKMYFSSGGKARQVTSKATNGLLRTFLVTVHFFKKSLNWKGWFNALTPFDEVWAQLRTKMVRYTCTVVTVHLMHRIFEFFLEPKCRLDEVSFFIFAFLSSLKSFLLQLTKYQLAGTPRSA